MTNKKRIIITSVIALIILFVSLFLVKPLTSNDFYRISNEYLNSKILDMLKLSGGFIGLSVPVSIVPFVGTSLAAQFAKIGEYCLGVLSILYAEKYLMILLPLLSLQFVIPIGSISLIINCIYEAKYEKNSFFKKLSNSLYIIGILLIIVMPLSITISKKVQEINDDQIAYRNSEIEAFKSELYQYEDDASIFEVISTFSSDTVSLITESANVALNNGIDNLSANIVTLFLIPLATALILVVVCKLLIQIICKYTGNEELYAGAIEPMNKLEDNIINSTKNLFAVDERNLELRRKYDESANVINEIFNDSNIEIDTNNEVDEIKE